MRESKPNQLNLNDVSAESLMNASLNKDAFDQNLVKAQPVKSPVLKAAKIFENQMLPSITVPAADSKSIEERK